MRYTPVELRHIKLGRALFGYKRTEVDKLLEDVVDSFEEVWRDRGELTDKLEDVEKLLADVKQRESLLASTLVSAERAAVDARDAARREAELIVAEAHQESRSVLRAAQGERERLFTEARRVETLLRAALGMVEETRAARPPVATPEIAPESAEEPQPTPIRESWPKREDTREFQAVDPPKLPPPIEDDDQTDENDDDEGGGGGDWAARDFAWG